MKILVKARRYTAAGYCVEPDYNEIWIESSCIEHIIHRENDKMCIVHLLSGINVAVDDDQFYQHLFPYMNAHEPGPRP